jgi:hypothetical protein
MALKLNQPQVTTINTENNHENLEEQEDNPFEYFLQSNA